MRMLCAALVVLALPGPAIGAEGGDSLIDLDDIGESSISGTADRRGRLLERFEPRENDAFRPGERLVYSVRYGIIRAGEATLSVGDPVNVNGRQCYEVTGTAESNDFFSSVFRVDDRMHTYLDTDFIFPWRFRKELNEGGYHAQQRIELDQINQVATYHDGESVEMNPAAHDMLSPLYYIRTLDLKPGSRVNLRTHADKKNVDLEIFVRERKRVETPAGEFDCLVVEPKILLDTGLYDHEKGKLEIYLTDDERKLPVLFKVKVFFGSLVLTLTDHSQGTVARG